MIRWVTIWWARRREMETGVRCGTRLVVATVSRTREMCSQAVQLKPMAERIQLDYCTAMFVWLENGAVRPGAASRCEGFGLDSRRGRAAACLALGSSRGVLAFPAHAAPVRHRCGTGAARPHAVPTQPCRALGPVSASCGQTDRHVAASTMLLHCRGTQLGA